MSDLSLLRHYITKDEPFGPIDTFQVGEVDIEVLKLLFDKQNRIYKSFRDRPSIIMGRRGSGKTSYLRSVYFDDQYSDRIEISTATLLEQIASIVQELSHDTVFTETLAKLWEKTLWTCALAWLRSNSETQPADATAIDNYLNSMNVNRGDSNDIVLWKIADLYKGEVENNPKNGLSNILKLFDQRNFNEAKAVIVGQCRSKEKRIVILLDSLEDFKLNIESVERAIQGLLKCVGAMNNPREVLDVRLCLPTELSGKVSGLSSNAIKDFNRQVKLEWTPKELISLGAQRLMYYIDIHYPRLLKGRSPQVELSREESHGLFRMALPEWITNQRGFREQSISYILRHTQLLPRHLLLILNSVFKRSGATQLLSPFPVEEKKIIYGIRQVEEKIVTEIFSAFKMIHPTAKDVCERCLPHLPRVFSTGELRKTFTQYGKVVFHGGEFFEFRQMLIDIGAIGRVMPEMETDVYIKGKFKYTAGHELMVSYEDQLCLHPLFSGIYVNNGKDERPVYPEGSGMNDQDYRNLDD
ncbi:MAG: hypothetical protein HFACDABA_01946 [Anaerolineales bacterium]|nr:hypothetical protein [Anaerolineales bacterium]